MAGVRENEGALVERRRESIRPRLGDVAGDGAWRRPTIEVEPLSPRLLHAAIAKGLKLQFLAVHRMISATISRVIFSALFGLAIAARSSRAT